MFIENLRILLFLQSLLVSMAWFTKEIKYPISYSLKLEHLFLLSLIFCVNKCTFRPDSHRTLTLSSKYLIYSHLPLTLSLTLLMLLAMIWARPRRKCDSHRPLTLTHIAPRKIYFDLIVSVPTRCECFGRNALNNIWAGAWVRALAYGVNQALVKVHKIYSIISILSKNLWYSLKEWIFFDCSETVWPQKFVLLQNVNPRTQRRTYPYLTNLKLQHLYHLQCVKRCRIFRRSRVPYFCWKAR